MYSPLPELGPDSPTLFLFFIFCQLAASPVIRSGPTCSDSMRTDFRGHNTVRTAVVL